MSDSMPGRGLFIGTAAVAFILGWLTGHDTDSEADAPPPEVKVKTLTEEKVVTKEVPAELPESCVATIEAMNLFDTSIDLMDGAAGQISLLASDVQKFSAVDDFNNTVLSIEELNKQVDILDSEVIAKSDAIREINSHLAICEDEID